MANKVQNHLQPVATGSIGHHLAARKSPFLAVCPQSPQKGGPMQFDNNIIIQHGIIDTRERLTALLANLTFPTTQRLIADLKLLQQHYQIVPDIESLDSFAQLYLGANEAVIADVIELVTKVQTWRVRDE
jgi:hypothetical protein